MIKDRGKLQKSALLAGLNASLDPALRVPSLQRKKVTVTAPSLTPALSGTLDSLSRINGAGSLLEAVAICRELLDCCFARRALAFGWRNEEGDCFSIAGGGGILLKGDAIPETVVHDFLGPQWVRKSLWIDDAMRRVYQGVLAETVTNFPLASGGVLLGFISLFDCEPLEGDLLLVELIANLVAARLMLLRREKEFAGQNRLSSRMMSLTNALVRSRSKEELYRIILESASDLLHAGQGSVMLLDPDGEQMHLVQAKGMGGDVARSLTLQVGVGIAGGVAQSGTALLVQDVEKDLRVARRNRPRFKTKSLISMPLKLDDKVLGVLNLSDKANLASFCEADLKLLSSFGILAALMIERTQSREETCRLEQLSCTDPLTSTYNRRFLNARLEEELNRSRRQGLEFTILFIDLDLFKQYNDLFGHLAGDDALRDISEIIKGALRDMDIVARFGGEEFCVLLPGTSKHLGMLVAERIREGIEREMAQGGEGAVPARLTASIGVACFPRDGVSSSSLLYASDMALYHAKENGRNQVVSAQPGFIPASYRECFPA